MSSTVHDIPPEVLTLLPIPAVEDMTDDQTRGATCVWGGERLRADSAIDLGERLEPLEGSTSTTGVRLFLRGCAPHAGPAALQALQAHASGCEQCVDDVSRCETGLGLNRMMREARR